VSEPFTRLSKRAQGRQRVAATPSWREDDKCLRFGALCRQSDRAASLRETDDHCELTVSFALSPEIELGTAVHNALIGWLAQQGLPLVLAEDGDETYVLRPPSD
jgi:hypothetical protein